MKFEQWWSTGTRSPNNPYKADSPAFWAWEGWQAGVGIEREACAQAVEVPIQDPRDVFEESEMNDAICFYATSDNEIMRITKDGIWIKPGLPVDDIAKAVLDLLGEYVKKMVQTAVMDEREACAKVCDQRSIEDSWEGGYADACAEEIRARGKK
jgi:hypothetical protein